MRKFVLLLFFIINLFLFGINGPVYGQPSKGETLEGKIVSVLEEKETTVAGKTQLYQKLKIKITSGFLKGESVIVENGNFPLANIQKYQLNDYLSISYTKDQNGKDIFYITDYIRKWPLLFLFLIFVGFTVAIAKWRGLMSLFGMVISFLMIFYSILPNILSGHSPLLSVILASIFAVPIIFYLSHGLNKKTTVAIIGSLISLIIAGILAALFINLTKLTGFSSEEASFLQTFKGVSINMQGILLAGVIIGLLGVLDDITVSQAAVVFELRRANKKLDYGELYRQAMNVGQDHISSMVNTLILVYAGASLPLFLLFVHNPHPFFEIINYEIVAEEIVRTLIGSIGLILAVPITTYLAVKTK